MNENKKMLAKILKKRLVAFAATVMLLLTPAHAAGLVDSKIVTGLVNLINDVSTVMILLCPLTATAVWGWCMVRKGSSEDETDIKMWKKRAFNAVVCGVAGMLGSAIITLITSYFI